MGNKTYIALTIGPIYKTLTDAKRTRSVWASSYFFSWFMRSLLSECKEMSMNIYLPYSDDIFSSHYGSGLYADRIYFEKDEATTKEKLIKIAKKIIDNIEIKSAEMINKGFLKQYLNIHIIEKEINKEELNGSFTLAVLNSILDNKELFINAPFDAEKNPLQDYLLNSNLKNNFLNTDAFGLENTIRKFRSISEIATTTLQRTDTSGNYINALHKDFKNEDIDFIEELKKQHFDVLPYHKYYAVLYADGDNIGKMLEEIELGNKDLKGFSKCLFEFGLNAEKIIKDYGGNGIYLGGEDILAFLPVACIDKSKLSVKTLMYLVKTLDDEFEKSVIRFAKENSLSEPTLSYGIMISYIKHPLKESMDKAHKLLEAAKKKISKNSVGMKFQKHSGQYTECIIEKSKRSSLYEIFSLINKYSVTLNLQSNEVLSSVIQRFKDDVFFTLFYKSAYEKRLDSFFDNFFNEDIHKSDTPQRKFLLDVQKFCEKIVNDYPQKNDCKNILLTILRFIHFINSKKD